MHLFDENGDIWDPNFEETRVLDDLLRRIVDAIRYRRVPIQSADAYAEAVAKLTEAVTDYTATLRADPAAAGPTPTMSAPRQLVVSR